MDTESLINRIRRIYASIDAMQEFNFQNLPATVVETDRIIGIFQDFKGGMSKEELENVAYLMIHNIAHLQNHLRRWAVRNSKDETLVDSVFKNSGHLQIIKDLSNNEKHGYPPRNNGYSGKAPRLENINRICKLTTSPKKGASIALTIDAQGRSKILGSGRAAVIITGDIFDKNNNRIGDLHDTALAAINSWEMLLKDFEF